jgi:hypothetical protein
MFGVIHRTIGRGVDSRISRNPTESKGGVGETPPPGALGTAELDLPARW